MAIAPNATETTKPIDDAMELCRLLTTDGTFDAEDLIAQLGMTKSRIERAAVALHLAEKFLHLVRTAPLDKGVEVVGHDLARAIANAKGIPSVLTFYKQMARDAEQVAA